MAHYHIVAHFSTALSVEADSAQEALSKFARFSKEVDVSFDNMPIKLGNFHMYLVPAELDKPASNNISSAFSRQDSNEVDLFADSMVIAPSKKLN